MVNNIITTIILFFTTVKDALCDVRDILQGIFTSRFDEDEISDLEHLIRAFEDAEDEDYEFEESNPDYGILKNYSSSVLVSSYDWRLRAAAAQLNHHLDILVNDKSPYVRAIVASKGYGLDTLVHDADERVRAIMAVKGYCLDTLAEDKSSFVRAAVHFKKHDMFEMYDSNTVVCSKQKAFKNSIVSSSKLIDAMDAALAEVENIIWFELEDDDEIETYESAKAKLSSAETWDLKELVSDENEYILMAVAYLGYGLDVLVDDPSSWVQFTVACRGFGLDKLIKNEWWGVRAAVANYGYRLEALLKDSNFSVCRIAANKAVESNWQFELATWVYICDLLEMADCYPPDDDDCWSLYWPDNYCPSEYGGWRSLFSSDKDFEDYCNSCDD